MSQLLSQKITFRSVMKFTLPSVVMMVFMSLYTIVDGIFVARFVNTDALSAINVVYPLFSLIAAIGIMFGTGGSAIIAKRMGEQKNREAKEDFTFIIIAGIFISMIMLAAGFVFLKPVIYFLGANSIIYEYCHQYAWMLLFFTPAAVLQMLFQYLFVTAGKPRLGLLTTVGGGMANIVLDYVFIGLLQMGVEGAAIATGIGYCIPAVFGLFYFTIQRKEALYFVKPKFRFRILLRSSVNGMSEMVGNLAVGITTYLFNIIMMEYLGQDGVAAITIVLYMDFLLLAINFGYAMGISPIISYNYGSENHENMKKIFRISSVFTIVLSIAIALGTFAFAGLLVGVFAERGSEVYKIAKAGMRIYAFSYLFKGYNVFSSALFTALSNGIVSAILSFARTLLFLIISVIGLTILFGVSGVWYAVPIAEFAALLLSVVYIYVYRKQYHYLAA